MKVLLIDVNCKDSSTGRIVYDIYSYLNSQGEEAAVCYGRGKNISEKNIFKFGIDLETYFHAFLTRLTGYTGCFSFFSTRRLIEFIKKFKPDVVHIHELHAYFVNIKPLLTYLKEQNIKTVMTLHCEFAYTGKCGHAEECENWKTQCTNCPRLKEYPSVMFFDHTKHMYLQKKKLLEDFPNLTVLTPSKWLAERTKQSFLKGHSISVVHNGIDTDVFKPQDATALKEKFGITNTEKVVLALAPNLMSESKGGNIVKKIADKLNCEKIRFIFVGVDGAEETVNGNTITVGRVFDSRLLSEYYSLADLFVICSRKENFPTTCLEAQCCGTPVYGFNTGGTLETSLQGDVNFTEYGDIDALAELIKNAPLKTENKSYELSKLAKEKFGKDRMCDDYLKIYRN